MPNARDRRKRLVRSIGPSVKIRKKKAIRPKTGKLLERKYGQEIRSLLAPVFQAINDQIKIILPRVTQQAKEENRIDQRSYSEVITEAFNGVKVSVAGQLPDPLISQLVDEHGRRISSFSGKQTDAAFNSVLGVPPVRAESYIGGQLSTFSQRNTALIKSIPSKLLDDVETIVRIGVDRGLSISEISKSITDKTGSAKKRANLIARDQVQKFNGKLNELRQREVGVTKYIWSTSRDPDVRDEHADREGEVFSWSNPPEDGHPGEPINCRCTAIPVMDELITEVELSQRSFSFAA